MHTKDILAAALRELQLEELAKQAETGYYHDFLSPLAMPELALVNDLNGEMLKTSGKRREDIYNLRNRVIGGDFDASAEESDEWAAGPEGQEAFRKLIR